MQASLRVEGTDGTVLTACDRCREVYGGRTPPEEPPCDTCRVELMEENDEPARIYLISRGQVITSMGQTIDINHVALWENIDRYKIKEPVRCFELVNNVFHHFLKIMNSETE